MDITLKQWIAISRIYEYLGIEFTGTTRKEASAFISLYIEESKREEELDTIMAHVQYSEHCFI